MIGIIPQSNLKIVTITPKYETLNMIKTRNIINTESQEIFIGDNTSAYLLHLQEHGEDVSFFYRSAVFIRGIRS